MTARTPAPVRLCVFLFLLALPSAALAGARAPSFAPTGDGPQYTEAANGTDTAVPSLEAQYIGGMEFVLDGVLDDEVWDMAQTGWGFRQAEPNRWTDASVPSVFKVLYDDDAIYFGMACYEDDMANVSSYLSRRDQIEASDVVSIYIDPYHDRTTGYNFRVNPNGVQQDAYLFDNGNRDVDWNAVWEAEVSSDEKGWYVEIRVPFSAIRFKPSEDMTWGLQAYRWLHGRGEDTGWVLWDRNASGFVSRWGNLTGLRGVKNPSKLEVLPYVVTKHTDPAAEGDADTWQNSQNIGADFKYNLTANLTLNATFQPDFGQVEADPATLNLSPFETFFQEKRPFFVEGARFFQHPDFNLFYSRRIGTGDSNSRIRGAAKINGKIGGDLSLAVLAAATDVGQEGRAHNPFVSGDQKAYYGLVRVGKEFDDGNHSVNVMGTAVRRDDDSFAQIDDARYRRNGYTGGFDFMMNFDDRNYRISGSAVGSVIDPVLDPIDPTVSTDKRYGTGGDIDLRKAGGKYRGGLVLHWESDNLDPNDMGFLSAPDEKVLFGHMSYHYDSDGEDKTFNRADFELEGHTSTFFAGNSGLDINTGQKVWEYEGNHHQSSRISYNMWGQLKSFHQGWVFLSQRFDGTSRYATRTYYDPFDPPQVTPNGNEQFIRYQGPLMTDPSMSTLAFGGTTDWRKPLSVHAEADFDWGSEGGRLAGYELSVRWNQSEHFSHWIGVGYSKNLADAQWMGNLANDGSQAGVTGIGGIDHVFGQLDQETFDLTLRSNILFNRDQSLQIYLQPFHSTGSYSDPRWLATPDSYDLRPYDIQASDYDFNVGEVNVNVVYRWEYRPGSTLFLVWTHGKFRFDQRSGFNGDEWKNGWDPGFAFDTEPTNTFLAKLTYWFSI